MGIALNFIGASYGVHDDFKSCVGVATDFGWAFSSMSCEQKLSAKSSTCSELVGVVDCVPKVSYFRLLIGAQNVVIK